MTGAGGFIGSHLALELVRRGERVVALDRNLERLRHVGSPERIDPIQGDFVEAEVQRRALEGVDTVYHLAAAHLGVAVRSEEFWRVNVEGVRTFARAAAQAGIRRFVHCSSVGVYGRIERPPADEQTPCHPDLLYGRTKLAGERMILESVAEDGLPAVILRPVWVYGPGCPRTEKLFRAVKKGRFVLAGRRPNLRHCVYIRDMVDALRLAAAAQAVQGQVIIVGDAEAVSVRRLVDEIARVSGARPPRAVPLSLLTLAAVAAEGAFRPLGREPPISRRSLEFFTANTAFRIARARRLLHYEPKYDLKAGLAETHRLLYGEARVPFGNGTASRPAAGAPGGSEPGPQQTGEAPGPGP